jgi:hypothetical protein
MAAQLENSPEASSSTAAEKDVFATLRARLRSEDPFPAFNGLPSSSAESCSKHHDIYKQLRSVFSSIAWPRVSSASGAGKIIVDDLAGT